MTELFSTPLKLINSIQHYDWGTRNEDAFIPRLLGFEPERDKPYAELWIGAHPKAPSQVLVNGEKTSLLELIEKYPTEVLGKEVANNFNNKLPFLLKVLSAGKALSIQTHPNKEQAEFLHKRDPENYPDDNHKPEIAIALDSLYALAGLKSVEAIKEVLAEYQLLNDYLIENNFDFAERLSSSNNIHKELMGLILSQDANPKFEGLLLKIDEMLAGKQELRQFEKSYLEARAIYGVDSGLLNFFFFNFLHLEEGEGFFTGAGIPHAYLKGNIIECMANSDNVVRAGLTPKFKDVDTLKDILDYDAEPLKIIKPEGNTKCYDSEVTEFSLCIRDIEKDAQCKIETHKRIQVILILTGELTVSINDIYNAKFSGGEAFIIAGVNESYKINSDTDSKVVICSIPD